MTKKALLEATIEIDGHRFPFRLESLEGSAIVFTLHGNRYRAEILRVESSRVRLRLNGTLFDVALDRKGEGLWEATPLERTFEVKAEFLAQVAGWMRKAGGGKRSESGGADRAGEGAVTAPMPGKILAVFVEKGQAVEKGEALLTLEAMKMENRIQAPFDGVVEDVRVAAGRDVAKGEVMVTIRPQEAHSDERA